MKILFVIQNMKVGGVQRSLLNITDELIKRGHKVNYLIIDYSGDLIKNIRQEVDVIILPKSKQKIARLYQKSFREIVKSYKIIDVLLKIILSVIKRIGLSELISVFVLSSVKINSKYDQMISFDGMPSIADDAIKLINKDGVKVCWIHNDIKHFDIPLQILRNHYSKFDKIAIVSEACKSSFIDLFPDLNNRVYTVYNMFNCKDIVLKAGHNTPYKEDKKINFVVVARMYNTAKRIDRIINAIAKLKKDGYENFCVYMIGDGPSLNDYKQLTKEKKIKDKVAFMGNKTNPYPYIKHADVFIMSSEFEGYPMTLREALILGTPCITTNFSAAGEVIFHGENGIITDKSIDGIYNSMKYILDSKVVLERYKENIKTLDLSNNIAVKQFNNMLNLR